jgi:hypothetical protein
MQPLFFLMLAQPSESETQPPSASSAISDVDWFLFV